MEKEKLESIEGKVDQILSVLVGDLETPGFIEQTKSDLRKVDYRLNSLEGSRKAGIGALAAMVTGFLGKLFLGI